MQVHASFQPIKCPNFPANDGVLWSDHLHSVRSDIGVEAPLTTDRDHESEFVELQLKGENSPNKNRTRRKSIGGDVVNNRKQQKS